MMAVISTYAIETTRILIEKSSLTYYIRYKKPPKNWTKAKMDNVCQDNVTFDDRNLICMIMMIATNSKSFEALLSVSIETFLVTCNTSRFFLKIYRNYQTCSSNAKGKSLAQAYLFIMVKKAKCFTSYYLMDSNIYRQDSELWLAWPMVTKTTNHGYSWKWWLYNNSDDDDDDDVVSNEEHGKKR